MDDLAVVAPVARGRAAGIRLLTLLPGRRHARVTRRAIGALVGIPTALWLPAAPAVASTYATAVVAWGYDGDGQASVPAGLSGVTAVAAGERHSLALKSDGTVVAWGFNQFGQASVSPGLSGVTAVAGGGDHSLAVKSDGTVVAWGDNGYGQATVPAGLSGVTAVAGGGRHSLAVKSD